MARRRADDDEVADCLAFPSNRGLPVSGGRESRKRWDRYDPDRKRTINVVFEREADGAYTIVTVYWQP